MIVSNEPGYYEKNKFGIRIENLIYVKKNKNKLKFENLTMTPIEKDLIVGEMLDKKEIKWLNNYHKIVFKNLKSSMNKIETQQLQKACSAI
jgi:Xaa-Pro aminopeptidase